LGGRFQTEAGNTVQHNVHSLAGQGPALVLGDGAELDFNNPVENYVGGDEMMIRYVGTQTCARVTAGSWLLCGPTTNAAGVRLYNTHVFDVNDGADDVDLDIRGTLSQYTSIGNSHVRKTGAGTLRLASGSSTYRGTTVIRSGRLLAAASVPKGGNSVLGNCTDDVVIGDSGTLPADVPSFAFEGPANSAFTFARGIVTHATGGISAFGSHSNVNVTLSGAVTVSNTLHLLSSASGANALTVTGVISGTAA
jgi:autotransporter-associated beta strand protein